MGLTLSLQQSFSLRPPQDDFKHPAPCPSPGGPPQPQNLTVFIFHPKVRHLPARSRQMCNPIFVATASSQSIRR
eukprot:487409-Pleurochrysis_carterae.AAC.1